MSSLVSFQYQDNKTKEIKTLEIKEVFDYQPDDHSVGIRYAFLSCDSNLGTVDICDDGSFNSDDAQGRIIGDMIRFEGIFVTLVKMSGSKYTPYYGEVEEISLDS